MAALRRMVDETIILYSTTIVQIKRNFMPYPRSVDISLLLPYVDAAL